MSKSGGYRLKNQKNIYKIQSSSKKMYYLGKYRYKIEDLSNTDIIRGIIKSLKMPTKEELLECIRENLEYLNFTGRNYIENLEDYIYYKIKGNDFLEVNYNKHDPNNNVYKMTFMFNHWKVECESEMYSGGMVFLSGARTRYQKLILKNNPEYAKVIVYVLAQSFKRNYDNAIRKNVKQEPKESIVNKFENQLVDLLKIIGLEYSGDLQLLITEGEEQVDLDLIKIIENENQNDDSFKE